MKKADADPVAVDSNRRRFLEREGVVPEQTVLVHLSYDSEDFTRYGVVNETDAGDGITHDVKQIADGLATQTKNLALFLPLADCIGVVLYDPVHQAVMLTHLGRHNLEQQGGQKSVEFMAMRFGSDPGQLEVYFSPSAGKENYPVFSFDGQSLADVALAQLTTAGVKRTNITLSPIDTTTDQEYFSHSQYLKGKRANDGRFAIVARLI